MEKDIRISNIEFLYIEVSILRQKYLRRRCKISSRDGDIRRAIRRNMTFGFALQTPLRRMYIQCVLYYIYRIRRGGEGDEGGGDGKGEREERAIA